MPRPVAPAPLRPCATGRTVIIVRTKPTNLPRLAVIAVVMLAVSGAALWWLFAPRTRTQQLDISAFYGSPASATMGIDVGSCLADVTVHVDETADQVRIGATIQWNPADACPAILERVPVALARPLGDRAVIDATTGDAVTVVAPELP